MNCYFESVGKDGNFSCTALTVKECEGASCPFRQTMEERMKRIVRYGDGKEYAFRKRAEKKESINE